MVVGGTMVAGPFPPLAACLFWAILLLINVVVSRLFRGKTLLNRSELLIVLAVWLVANMVAGRGMLHPLLASIVGATYYSRSALSENLLASNVPDWLAITDKPAARAFFEGHDAAVPWALWVRPLLTWSLFFVPFLLANVCLCALFERVWVRHERLAFPLVALPIELLGLRQDGQSGAGSLSVASAKMRVPFLFGLAFPLLLHGFGVAHAYLPGIPCVPFFNDLSGLFDAFPMSSLRPVYVNLYPILIGLTFLAPADVTLGIWLFLLINKAQMFAAAASGWNDGVIANSTVSVPPYIEEQSAGAYLALAGILLFHSRHHLRKIGATMRFQRRNIESDYAIYRPLAWGFVSGIVGVLAWCFVVGFPLWFAILFFGFYFAVALVLARLMAEGGVSWILGPILPDKLILTLFGSAAVSPVVVTRLMYWMQHLRDTRQMLAPAAFEAGKLRDTVGFPLRRFYALLFAGVVLALVVGTLRALPLFYQHGALSLTPNSDGLMMTSSVIPTTALNQATSRMMTPIKPSLVAGVAVVFGAFITLLLSSLRLRFFWFPLHPLGYALTGTIQLGYANKMLFSVFIGWAFKALTQRFGGVHGFRYLRGAAFGMIVGDLLVGSLIKLLDALLGPSGYAIF